ncbi:MAG: hypothetical protein GY716_12910 [bacterium]|nr:hypothetical protein [bacterium]
MSHLLPPKVRNAAVAGALFATLPLCALADGERSQPWWSATRENIRRAEYRVSVQDGLHAANRAQNLRLRFRADGTEIVRRSVASPSWSLSLALDRVDGRAVDSVEPLAADDEVLFRRGPVSERWHNAPGGLSIRPAWNDPDRDGPSEAIYRVATDLEPVPAADHGSICFYREGRRAVCLEATEGGRIALDGDRLTLAADEEADGISLLLVGAGSRSARSSLADTPDWLADGNRSRANFAQALATAGDVNGDGFSDVIVGAPDFDNGLFKQGRAFLFLGSSNGLATSPTWTSDGDQAEGLFGSAVGPAGDVNGDGFDDVAIAADNHTNGEDGEGRVDVFLGSATGLPASPSWTAESDQARARFGRAVSTAGDVNGDGFDDIIVGAAAFDNGEVNEGAAFAFLGSSTGLAASPAWSAEGDAVNAQLGSSVSAAGDVDGDGFDDVIVGSPSFENPEIEEGRALVYLGSASGLAATPVWSAESDEIFGRLGESVSYAGDVNGDGYADVVVGAPLVDGEDCGEFSKCNRGLVLVYYGSPAGPSTEPDWTVEGDQDFSRLGSSVAGAGDLNGDGLADLVLGAARYDNGQEDEGRIQVHLGSFDGPSIVPDWTAEGGQREANFGTAVAAAGDVNGDGFGDIVVGVPLGEGLQIDEGQAFVFAGSPDGPSELPVWTGESDQQSAQFGVSVGSAGDVNSDGYGDLLVGASVFDDGVTRGGRAYLYLGSAAGLSLQPIWTQGLAQAGALFGASTSHAGDVNGDGFSDALVGAPGFDNGQLNEGVAYLYLGDASGLSLDPAWSVELDQDSANVGGAVADAGDVNGDGFGDVLVGAPFYSNGETREGRVLLYDGSAAGLSATPSWIGETDYADERLGSALDGAGDINGDGFADIVAGAPFYGDDGLAAEGRVLTFLGNGTGGVGRPRDQLRLDDSTIGLLGRSDSEDSFRLSHVARSAAGRDRIRLDWQAEPLGVDFDGATVSSGDTTDSGMPGAAGSTVELSAIVDELPAERRLCENRTPCETDADCTGVGNGLCGSEPINAYHWRLRTSADSPYFPRTPWISQPYNSVTETKLRTTAEIPPPTFRLAGPATNEDVFPDSPPLAFSWNSGAFESFVVEWSRNPEFESVVERSDEIQAATAGSYQVFAPDDELWGRILLLGQSLDFRGAPVFWRIIPTDAAANTDDLEFRVLRVTAAGPPVLISPFDGAEFEPSQPPELIWAPNHNDRFRVRFAGTPALAWPRVDSGAEFDLTQSTWRVPEETWDRVVDLARSDPEGIVYYAVFALDGLERPTVSRVRELRVLGVGGTARKNLRPGVGAGRPHGPRTGGNRRPERP